MALRHWKSPLRGIEMYEATDPSLFRTYGLIEFLGIPHVDPFYLDVLIAATGIVWVCAAIGFFTRFSMVATAIGAACLHGYFLGAIALNHNWFLSIYAFGCLCFARTNDRWSVDYHLRRWRKRPTSLRPSLTDTGFARKLFLVATVGFYFAAGMSKLYEGGIQWADGHTIQYFTQIRGSDYLIGDFVAERMWLCNLLGVSTLLLELGAVAALFSQRALWILILGWTCLHAGIKLSVGPSYTQNVVCFLLLIDWGALRRDIAKWVPSLSEIAIGAESRPSRLPRRTGRMAAALGSGYLLLTLYVAVGQVFWWPVTNVYMYCSYFSFPNGFRASIEETRYHQVEQAQEIARNFLSEKPPIEATEYFSYLPKLRLVGAGGEPFYLEDPPGVWEAKQWILTVLRPALIRDLASKPDGRIEFDPGNPDYPAQRLLADYVSVVRASLSPLQQRNFQRLELVYPLSDGDKPIAAVPLHAISPTQAGRP